MNKFSLGLSIFDAIFKLVPFVEKLFKGKPKSGAEKKALVLGGVKSLVEGAEEIAGVVATGGAKSTWDKIGKHVPGMIDTAAASFFPKKNAALTPSLTEDEKINK